LIETGGRQIERRLSDRLRPPAVGAPFQRLHDRQLDRQHDARDDEDRGPDQAVEDQERDERVDAERARREAEDVSAICGEVAGKVLGGTSAGSLTPMPPRKVTYAVNLKTAGVIDLELPPELIQGAAQVFQ
jgi:hypothetical protein